MVERAVPDLPADDLGVAKAFYVDKLGFSILFEETPDGRHGILGLRRGDLYLTLHAPMTGHGRLACATLHVKSADAYYAEWSSKVDIDAPPKNEYWGGRTFGLSDPAGNTIFVIGPAT